MSNIALIKKSYNQPNYITAKEAIKGDNNKIYYCPNNKCNAELYICSRNGTKYPYFSANHKYKKHIKFCPYSSWNLKGFKLNEYNEESFVFENAIKNICSNNEIYRREKGKKVINTLHQIYCLTLSYDLSHKYGETLIKEMIVDDRTEFLYTKFIKGYKLVYTNCSNIKIKEKTLIFSLFNKFDFEVKIYNENNFNDIKQGIENNKKRGFLFAGRLYQTDNKISSSLKTKKQYKII